MSNETRKANQRRARDPLFARIFRGHGIDIGHGGDRLNRDGLFPQIQRCDGFEIEDGDAQYILRYLPPGSYDFVYSSHCLEHLPDPICALQNWFGLLRPQGFMVIVVPDEDLYEQGVWPSRFNSSHLWTFTIAKRSSWSRRSVNMVDAMLDGLCNFSFVRLSLLDDQYDYSILGVDQSQRGAETSIEAIIRKDCD